MAPNSRNLVLTVLIFCNASLVFWAILKRPDMLNAVDAPVWSFDSSRKYYVVDSEWADFQGKLKKLPEVKELPISKDEVMSRVVDLVSKSNSALMDKIETDLRDKHSGELKKSLEKQLKAELREQKSSLSFYHQSKSFKILDDMRARYLKDNDKRLQNLIIQDFLKNTIDEDLKKRVTKLESLTVNRQKYFHNVIRDMLGRNEPYGFGVEDKGESFQGMSVELPPDHVLSEEYLTENRVQLPINDFLELQDKHTSVVKELKGLSRPPKEIYSGEGIVIAARKKDMLGALNVIVQLREEGSELPVEVVLNTKQEYNEHFCGKVLPGLNAKCVVAETEIGSEAYKYLNFKEETFPLKALALVVSSFDNTVYLDADNFPIKNVDEIFTSEPYLDTKCIFWPDLWHRTTSPKFYEIAGIAPGEVVKRSGIPNDGSFKDYIANDKKTKVAFHDLANIPSTKSVESGQIVVSKSDHFRALFLALYYNLNGPRYYYHLLYQGTHGEGDRETFVPAFEVMKESYYLNEWDVSNTGVERKKPHNGELYFDESTLMQSDPGETAKYLKSWRRWLREKGMDSRIDPNENNKFTQELRYNFYVENNKVRLPKALFLHVHDPKINSLANELSDKTRYDYETRYIKKMSEHEYAMGPRDWELRFQAINAWSTCEAFIDPQFWRDFGVDQGALCKKSREYVEKLKKTSNDVEAAELKTIKVKSST